MNNMKQLLLPFFAAATLLVACGETVQEGPKASSTQGETVQTSIEDGVYVLNKVKPKVTWSCLLYTSPSPRDATLSRMPSSA